MSDKLEAAYGEYGAAIAALEQARTDLAVNRKSRDVHLVSALQDAVKLAEARARNADAAIERLRLSEATP